MQLRGILRYMCSPHLLYLKHHELMNQFSHAFNTYLIKAGTLEY